jgi:hypothetical protein
MAVNLDYHCIFHDEQVTRVLVDPTAAPHLLPVLHYEGPMFEFERVLTPALRRFAVAATPVHEAELPLSVPQRPQSAYCGLVVSHLGDGSPLHWMSLADLLQLDAGSRDQTTALQTYLVRLRYPQAPFDSLEQVRETERWAGAQLAARGYRDVRLHRVPRHGRRRRVALFRTASADFYFKAKQQTLEHEVRITDALARTAPGCYGVTIAVEPARAWWLREAVTGRVLRQQELTYDAAVQMGSGLAQLQRRALAYPDVAAPFGHYTISENDLTQLAMVARLHVHRAAAVDAKLLDLLDNSLWRDVAACCRQVCALPSSVIHVDLGLPNIVLQESSVGLIDLEGALWGPAPLCLWPLIRDVYKGGGQQLAAAMVEGYLAGWRGAADLARLAASVDELDVTGPLLMLRRGLSQSGRITLSFGSKVRTHGVGNRFFASLRACAARRESARG